MSWSGVAAIWGCLLIGWALWRLAQRIYIAGAAFGYVTTMRDLNLKDKPNASPRED